MANVLCVLYDDPVDGYPPSYARDDVPAIERYNDGQSTPAPEALGFEPGELVGSVSGELGLREFLEQRGHRLIVTSDKDGPDSVFERELPEAEVVISQPFWPAYLTAERIAKAPKLKLALTAGIGSDHVDLQAAIERGLTVAEVTYSNSISVAEHVVMMILALVRNYIPSYQQVVEGGWNIADCVSRSYDLEGMQVGTVAAGRIGSAVLRRLKPFEVGLHYTDRHRLPPEVEEELGVTFHPDAESMVEVCDVVTINAPLHPETENLFDARDARQDEAGLLPDQHRAGKDLRSRRGRAGLRERPACGLRRRRVVSPAGAPGPPLALDAPPRHDSTHLRHQPLRPGPLRGRDARDPRVLVRRAADSRGVPDRRRRQAGRCRRPLLQRGRRDGRLRGGRPLQERLTRGEAVSDEDARGGARGVRRAACRPGGRARRAARRGRGDDRRQGDSEPPHLEARPARDGQAPARRP
jgi:lactate dehydrogenase-like 2-hydroxyacid dehydrogenase